MALILASASSIRRQMLEAADVAFCIEPSAIDESKIKANLRDPEQIATELAKMKALALDSPGSWIIGSDSVVSVDGRTFDKPSSLEEARQHLQFFSGKVMQLISAVALARDGEVNWSHTETAQLHVRKLSEPFIEAYLQREWPEVGYCVGVFRMEGRGVQLFEAVNGNHFTILGMPLVPLLNALRERELIPS